MPIIITQHFYMDAQINDVHIKDLQGKVIEQIFINAEHIAELHAVLTSSLGGPFRRKILQNLGEGKTVKQIEAFRKDNGHEEVTRHINQLLAFKLIEPLSQGKSTTYIRTPLGERAINYVRKLEGKIDPERANKIFQSALGKNSIRMFLKVYGLPKEPKDGDIVYTPLEIGQISTFLPRSIEGVAAIDKLDDAGLVSYLEDGRIHINPRRSVAFYQYLKELYMLIFEQS